MISMVSLFDYLQFILHMGSAKPIGISEADFTLDILPTLENFLEFLPRKIPWWIIECLPSLPLISIKKQLF